MPKCGKLRCAAIVAHPDDCVIFAWPLMCHLDRHEWTVIYLTYNDTDRRAQEMREFWSSRNISTVFLGYVDDYRDLETGKISFDQLQAQQDLQSHARSFDLVVTHNADGDYGHLHHRFVHRAISQVEVPQIYFASTFNNNFVIEASQRYDTGSLPLHQSVIEEFHDRYTGRYFVTDLAKEMLDHG